MDPRQLFADERFAGCVYCGQETSTGDHVPSKVLLDDPLPTDLPVVTACQKCNVGFSLDEEYLACLVECVMFGSVAPHSLRREKVRRILREKPPLASRIGANCSEGASGNVLWEIDVDRVQNVVLKLARGHTAYEYSEPQLGEPKFLSFIPLGAMPEERRRTFETAHEEHVLPELGSRAFLRAIVASSEIVLDQGWVVMQEGRYRYLVSHSGATMVRMVLSEYLACEVVW